MALGSQNCCGTTDVHQVKGVSDKTSTPELFDEHHVAAEKTTAMALVVTIALIAILWRESSRTGLLVWSGLMAVAAPAPVITKKLTSPALWARLLIPSEFVLGLMWTSVTVLAMPDTALYQVVLGVVLMGVLLGTPITLPEFIHVYLAFTLPFTALAAAGYLLLAEGPARHLSWILVLAWVQALLLARTQQQLRLELAATLKQNQSLVASLEVAHADVSRTNVELAAHVTIADRLARIDRLTNLSNRLDFDEVLEARLQEIADGTSDRLTLAFLDLDRFKAVNDSLGHKAGDQLLRAVALRLSQAALPSETVARIGGDELVVISPDQHPDEVKRRLAEVFELPFAIEERTLTMTASIGIATTESMIDKDELIRRADRSQYRAKRSGGHGVVWTR